MHVTRKFLLFYLLPLLVASIGLPTVSAQDSTPTTPPSSTTQSAPGARDAAAVAVVEKSLAALGDVNAIAAIRAVVSTGTIVNVGSSTQIPFRWEEQVSGNHFEFRQETTVNGMTRVFASGHGKPGFGQLGQPAMRLSGQVEIAAIPVHLPALVLLLELQDPVYSIQSVGGSDSKQAIHVRIANTTDPVMQVFTQQDWYFDPRTFVPVRLEYRIPSVKNALHTLQSTCVYSSWVQKQGVQFPTTLLGLRNGKQFATQTISSFQPNAATNSTDFDLTLQPYGKGRVQ